MFEYLMPRLLLAPARGTMLDEDNKATLAEILRTYDFGLA